MSKVLTLAKTFPAWHPKKGQPTYFVEKVWESINIQPEFYKQSELSKHYQRFMAGPEMPKHHTIRSGKRYKTGDMVSLRVWSGRPYWTKQIAVAPDVEVRVIDFEICSETGDYLLNGRKLNYQRLEQLALNDGFADLDDFKLWFNVKRSEGFSGQLIIWNPAITY